MTLWPFMLSDKKPKIELQLEFDLDDDKTKRERIITAMENHSRRYLGRTWTKKEVTNTRVSNDIDSTKKEK